MSYRKLDIDGKMWNYVIGKVGVKIKSPKDKSTWVENYNVAGITKESYQAILRRDDDEGIPHLSIGPGDVRKYIDKHLRGKL